MPRENDVATVDTERPEGEYTSVQIITKLQKLHNLVVA